MRKLWTYNKELSTPTGVSINPTTSKIEMPATWWTYRKATKMMQRRREVKHSHALSFTTFFFFIFFLSSYSSYAELTDKGDIRKQKFEVLALVEIKSSLIGPHGVFMNWDGTRLDACSWNMITCSPDGFVVGLEIPSQNLSGTLSSSISNLTNLQTLLLQNNSITRHIPYEIGKLMKLNTLDLSTNNFNGQIPSCISHITNLQYLRVNNNSLTGTIPSSLANMAQLIFLVLSYNNLSGPVPRSLARTFNIMGNPQICPTGTEEDCNGTQHKPMSTTLNSSRNEASDGGTKIQKIVIAFGLSLTSLQENNHFSDGRNIRQKYPSDFRWISDYKQSVGNPSQFTDGFPRATETVGNPSVLRHLVPTDYRRNQVVVIL